MRRLPALLLILALWPMAAMAQLATLIADRIGIDASGNVITATGNVEILYDGQRLLASQIVYTRSTDRLQISGPITVIEKTGAVLTGNSAALSRDLRQGIIQGARFILDGQMQVAAAEMHRVDGRYSQLYKAVASSCNVCADRPVPLWQIRARRVVHDQLKRQLYFDNAWFEVAGLPVMYFPRLRMPDPTLKRATGFLMPEVKTSSTLGIGLKVPYFLTMGDHADLRLTGYASRRTRTVEGRFRRAFSFGSLEVNSALSVDDLTTDQLRAYLFAEGRFRLPRDFDLNLDLRLVSDEAYLLAYDYSDVDRLTNSAEITRTRRNEHMSFGVQKLRSLRANEIPAEDALATLLGRATYERRFSPPLLGGQASLTFDIEGHERIAESVDATLIAACATAGLAAGDCVARDVVRAGVASNWRRDWTLGNGLIVAAESQLAADFYWIGQDTNFSPALGHFTPSAAVELRWPLARTAKNGARDVLEPVLQIAWTDTLGADVPNEDSRLVDFDEGNLLNLSRFPGSDRYERGWRSTLGLSWTRLTPRGHEYSATLGKVFRRNDLGQFTRASGLDGGASDWLIAGQIKLDRLSLTNRSLFDDSFSFAKSETQVAWSSQKVTANGSFIFVVDDPAEGRTGDTAELNFDAAYHFNRNWTVSASGSYDANTDKATKAGLGLKYQNECLNVDLSLSRRFTSSTNVAATTDFGLQVSLNGFGQDGREHSRGCLKNG